MISKKFPVDFSVIIPTFNRSAFLKQAIISVLRQKGVSFEIIVRDDFSTDDTEKAVKSFKDKRIKYFKNKRRLRSALNVTQCFKNSKGNYIFTLGDDDFILKDNTLLEIKKIMKKYKLGIGKIGTISYESSINSPYKLVNLSNKLLVYKSNNTKNILAKSLGFGLGFYSGIIFDNTLVNQNQLINHMCFVYFPVAYNLIQDSGMAYIPNHFVISHLSTQMIPTYFSIKKFGSFFMEDLLSLAKDFLTGKDYEEYKHEYLRNEIILLPNVKYYTDYDNYFKVLKKLIFLDSKLLKEPKFYIFSLIGFMPNFFISLLREIFSYFSKDQVKKAVNQSNYYPEIQKMGFI